MKVPIPTGQSLRQPRFRGSAPISLGEAAGICEVRTSPQSPAAIASDGHCPEGSVAIQRSARDCVEMLPQMLVISVPSCITLYGLANWQSITPDHAHPEGGDIRASARPTARAPDTSTVPIARKTADKIANTIFV